MTSVILCLIFCLSMFYRLNWSLRDAKMKLWELGKINWRRKDQKLRLEESQGPKTEERRSYGTAKAVGMYRFSGTSVEKGEFCVEVTAKAVRCTALAVRCFSRPCSILSYR